MTRIVSVTPFTAYAVVTDDKDFPNYTRYSAASWTVAMGESDEQVYDCAELEAEFQRVLKAKDNWIPSTIPDGVITTTATFHWRGDRLFRLYEDGTEAEVPDPSIFKQLTTKQTIK